MTLSAMALQRLVAQVDEGIQGIQDALGRDGKGGRVRFPRGYLKTVNERISHFSWMDDNTLKRNLCYHLLFSDVLRWLLNRTDLNGVAKGMVVKHIIALMGAVVESLTIAAMRQLGQGKRNYAKRVEYLHAHEFTDAELRDELMWLWDARSSVHVYEVTNLELDAYEIKDSNRAVAATCKLRDALNEKFIELEFAVIED